MPAITFKKWRMELHLEPIFSLRKRLDTSREAEVSNKDVEKFGMPHLTHSHAILLFSVLLYTPYIVVDIPWQSI